MQETSRRLPDSHTSVLSRFAPVNPTEGTHAPPWTPTTTRNFVSLPVLTCVPRRSTVTHLPRGGDRRYGPAGPPDARHNREGPTPRDTSDGRWERQTSHTETLGPPAPRSRTVVDTRTHPASNPADLESGPRRPRPPQVTRTRGHNRSLSSN